MVDAVFVRTLSATFFVKNLCQLAPFLGILIPVVCNHNTMLVRREIILRRFVVKCENALSRLALKVGIDEVATSSLGFTKLYWQIGFLFGISHTSPWLAVLLAHPLLLSSFE